MRFLFVFLDVDIHTATQPRVSLPFLNPLYSPSRITLHARTRSMGLNDDIILLKVHFFSDWNKVETRNHWAPLSCWNTVKHPLLWANPESAQLHTATRLLTLYGMGKRTRRVKLVKLMSWDEVSKSVTAFHRWADVHPHSGKQGSSCVNWLYHSPNQYTPNGTRESQVDPYA